MTALDFLREFEQTRHVRIRKSGTRLRVKGALCAADRELLNFHRQRIVDALDGYPATLAPRLSSEQREAAGLTLMTHGVWTHAEGDHVADRILCGLIPFDDAAREAERAEAFAQQLLRARTHRL
jgi:hypothetical protein